MIEVSGTVDTEQQQDSRPNVSIQIDEVDSDSAYRWNKDLSSQESQVLVASLKQSQGHSSRLSVLNRSASRASLRE